MGASTCEIISEPRSARTDRTIPFTAVVVTYNEADLLRRCLESLTFCEQLLVVDLGSDDDSAGIARDCGAEVVPHAWVPVVEHVWPDVVPLARNAWIIRMDPDEVFPVDLVDDLIATIDRSPSLAAVSLPYQYYFRGTPLMTTPWGGVNHILKVFHKDRVQLAPRIHHGIAANAGCRTERLQADPKHAVQHDWGQSVRHLVEKHRRYVKQEGRLRYQNGERFSWPNWVRQTKYALEYSLFRRNGIRGGWHGVLLSAFYTWYVSTSLLSLRRFQMQLGPDD